VQINRRIESGYQLTTVELIETLFSLKSKDRASLEPGGVSIDANGTAHSGTFLARSHSFCPLSLRPLKYPLSAHTFVYIGSDRLYLFPRSHIITHKGRKVPGPVPGLPGLSCSLNSRDLRDQSSQEGTGRNQGQIAWHYYLGVSAHTAETAANGIVTVTGRSAI
jgi:hypothetical protein